MMKAWIHILKNMNDRLKIVRSKARRFSFLVVLFFLLISFQNCSQGKFDTEIAQKGSTSSSGSSTNTLGSGTGSTTKSPEELAAEAAAAEAEAKRLAEIEAARQERCKLGIKKPIIANAATINNMTFNFKVGLQAGSGDTTSDAQAVTVDASKGVDTSKINPADNCTFATTLRIAAVDPATDASRPAVFSSGIDMLGAPIVLGGTVTAFSSARSVVRVNPGNNNNTFATDSVSMRFDNQAQNRAIRCATGSLYYKVNIRVSTTNLTANLSSDSDPVYVKVNFSNSCWTEKKLVGSSDFPLNANAGGKVAIDGAWAAVLAPKDNNTGAVYMFNNPGSGWVFTQRITMPDAAATHVLSNIDLKSGIMAVSNSSHNTVGKVYIYKLSGSTWVHSQNITSPEPSVQFQKFGLGLALGNNMLAVGAPDHPRNNADSGKVYIFNYNGTTGLFGYNSELVGATETNYSFGQVIAISGNNMAIGAPTLINENYAGAVFVFSLSSNWTQQKVILPPSGTSAAASFGAAIALNGNTLAVGAPLHDDGSNVDKGKVFYYSDYAAALTHSLNGSIAGAKFGSSLGLNSDSLYVGSVGGGTNVSGVVDRHLISNLHSTDATTRNKKEYVQFSQDALANEFFGQSLDVSGSSIIIGAPAKSVPNDKGGAAYLYLVQ